MANLIITIIAIALLAIMAIAGAWYGSSAFQGAQAKAQATRLVASAQQLMNGWLAWSLDNGGTVNPTATLVTPYCNGTIPNFLIPAYVSSEPSLGDIGNQHGTFPMKWVFSRIGGSSGANCMPASGDPDALRLVRTWSAKTENICLEFNRQLGATGSPLNVSVPGGVRGYCGINDVNLNGVADAGDYVSFYWKVFK